MGLVSVLSFVMCISALGGMVLFGTGIVFTVIMMKRKAQSGKAVFIAVLVVCSVMFLVSLAVEIFCGWLMLGIMDYIV